jgi:N6-L-threonylcarbamoyladenine synthase
MKKNIILGIETSCDDTSIALCIDGRIIANCTKSTINEHKKFGGIIPEIAARGHEQNIFSQYLKAMKLAKITFNELTKIAYTDRPGLPGSLHVGKIFAKSLGCLLKIPVVPIDHLLGHIYSFCIDKKEKIKYPFLGVVVSGGNTIIYLIKEYNKYLILNQTSDDAAGEALDKIGRFLGYQYPGGL